ncbi:DUF2752 domain-containing protein [Flavivirga sp. 57AJ16]|uniref:DUF2752 domain-containing protein n=1 Tax=Flavivirga sp. 57AJ16 TaxID=3025307 RepID=UPI002365A0BA|nr:DUF2752 domain-containing protein [Flavivirga sp. 57AJ16]MDD7887005.1 DUF2752 domain-containing protein [Flavivirga sp. 57AJ16]
MAIIFIIIALIFISYLYYNYDPLGYKIFPKCPFYSLTEIYCPGCGSQRAAHKLLQGHILDGFKHNFLIVLLVAVLLYDASIKLIKIIFNRTVKNLLHDSKTTYAILIVIILFWILRNINLYPFTILAP